MKYKGSIHAVQSIVNSYGLGTLYTAHAVNTAREMVFLSTYFLVYEHLKSALSNQRSSKINNSSSYNAPVVVGGGVSLPASIYVPFSGGIAGAVGWFISFPLDAIKSNIQGRTLEDIKHSSRARAGEVGTLRMICGEHSVNENSN
jgi:hypothetical protein